MEWDKQKNIAIALGNAKATKGPTVINKNLKIYVRQRCKWSPMVTPRPDPVV